MKLLMPVLSLRIDDLHQQHRNKRQNNNNPTHDTRGPAQLESGVHIWEVERSALLMPS